MCRSCVRYFLGVTSILAPDCSNARSSAGFLRILVFSETTIHDPGSDFVHANHSSSVAVTDNTSRM